MISKKKEEIKNEMMIWMMIWIKQWHCQFSMSLYKIHIEIFNVLIPVVYKQ